MKDSIRFKLESVRDRFEEIAGLLADPDVIADQNQFRDLSMEYSRVEPIVKLFAEFETLDEDIAAAKEMANDDDPDVREMGEEELQGLTARRETLLLDLQKSLIPPDPYDNANVFLEIRAGTGGDEAAAPEPEEATEEAAAEEPAADAEEPAADAEAADGDVCCETTEPGEDGEPTTSYAMMARAGCEETGNTVVDADKCGAPAEEAEAEEGAADEGEAAAPSPKPKPAVKRTVTKPVKR